jgi:NAD(P)-dependent dehydrogenase (short-subunit alcohol dehydrogenase family)
LIQLLAKKLIEPMKNEPARVQLSAKAHQLLAERGVGISGGYPHQCGLSWRHRDADAQELVQGAGVEEHVKALHPIGRWADPSEIAKAVLFLSFRRRFVHGGPLLIVDGAMTAQ